MYVAIQEAWIWRNNFWQADSGKNWQSINLSVFCSREKVRQGRVLAALNHLCSCPWSLDMGDYFLEGSYNWQQQKHMSNYRTHSNKEVSQYKCVQLWTGYAAVLGGPEKVNFFRTPGTPKWFHQKSFWKIFWVLLLARFNSRIKPC